MSISFSPIYRFFLPLSTYLQILLPLHFYMFDYVTLPFVAIGLLFNLSCLRLFIELSTFWLELAKVFSGLS